METVFRKEIVVNKALIRGIGATVFIILTCLGAFVRIPLPFSPVPITLQTFFVLLSGAFLGSGLGTASQIGYIFLGVSGLSVFTASGAGLFYLAGPTTGYLFGFILASFLAGKFVRYAKNFALLFGLFFLASLIILGCGTIWLKLVLGSGAGNSFMAGFIPFLPGDLLKSGLAALIYLRLKPRLKETF